MSIGVNDTIAQGKSWLKARLKEGASCPLCNQRAQVYQRKITSGMVRSLISMYRKAGTTWIHVSEIESRARDHAMLAYWGLIEEMSAQGPHGGRAGYWRITENGKRYLFQGLVLPKYALVYNGKVLGYDGPNCNIKDAIGTKFNLQELLQGI